MKKILLFGLMLLGTLGIINANAGEQKTIHTIDFSTQESYPYYVMTAPEGSSFDVVDGVLVIENTVEQANGWDLQPFICDWFSLQEGYDYIVRVTMKASADGSANLSMGTWSAALNGTLEFTASTEYKAYEVNYTKSTVASSENNVHVLFQAGKYIGKVEISKVEIIEIAPDEPIVEPTWTNIIVNGDLAGEDLSCFQAKEYPAADPSPATVKDGAIEVTAVKKVSEAWDSQFWIALPYYLPEGTKYQIEFAYQATVAAKVGTQMHTNAGDYNHWQGIGDVSFTTEWQTFNGSGTVSKDQAGAYGLRSIAFNLTQDNDDVTYRIKDVKFSIDGALIESLAAEVAGKDLAVYKAKLDAAITEAEKVEVATKTPLSAEPFTKALDDAKAALAAEDATVASYQAAAKAIAEATKNLKDAPEIAPGTYYFYNVEAQKYLAAGSKYGTHAIVNAAGLDLGLDANGYIDTQIFNGASKHYLNGEYTDGDAFGWTFTKVEDGIYTISNGEKFLTANAAGDVVLGDDATAKAAQWKFFTKEERIAAFAAATADQPVDATFLIKNANFGRGDSERQKAWTVTASNKNLSGGADDNRCAESYHSTYSVSQVIANAPKGVYKLTAQGFYRQDGTDNENLPVIYVNDATSTFPLRTGSENSMNDASASFLKGQYAIAPAIYQLAEDGDLTVGTKLETNVTVWCIWDNFQLTYYGTEADITEIQFGDLIKKVEELRADATELKEEELLAATAAAIDAALAGSEEIEKTEEAYNSAIAALETAINNANKELKNKAAIAANYDVLNSTNFVTAEAYEAYKAIIDDYNAKFEAGTLTETVANPSIGGNIGWHANNVIDDYLLSTWSVGEDKCQNYDKSLYINTWSIEGEGHGSEFRTPFFEFWVGDGESLKPNTLSATLEGVTPGEYEVSVWVRARAKNGVNATEATGITLVANDGEPVDVTEGEQIGTSQFNIGEYVAKAVVGEDGKLVVKLIVAEGNNVSWLSFKNVKYSVPQKEFSLDVERYPGMGYGPTTATADLAEALSFLGVEAATAEMLSIVNPDGTEVSDYATYDGWFAADGTAKTWGDLNAADAPAAGVCVKFFQALEGGQFEICDMNGADVVGTTYTVKYALKANDKTAIFSINVKFVEKPVLALTYADLTNKKDVAVELTSELGKVYEAFTADVDVAAILAELGAESLNDVTVYAVQSDGTLDDNYKLGTTDGWRNAEGDWQSWGADARICVKADFALESAQIYYVGGMDGQTAEPGTYTATYAFVNAANEAVTLKVTLTYPAAEEPEIGTIIQTIDFATQESYPYYVMTAPEGSSFDVIDGALVIENTVEQANFWDLQPFVCDWFSLKAGYDYIVRITMKADADGSATINMGTWGGAMSKPIEFTASDEYQKYNVEFPASTVESANNDVHVLFQAGKYVGKVEIAKVEIIEIVPVAIESVETAAPAAQKNGKYMENGKLVIIKNGKKFNAAGQAIK